MSSVLQPDARPQGVSNTSKGAPRGASAGRSRSAYLIGLAVLGAVTLVYSNHFHNGFHFDDYGRIPENVFVRDLSNIPKFFTDETTSSTLVATRLRRASVRPRSFSPSAARGRSARYT